MLANVGGGPNGAAWGPDGAMYITNNGGCFSWDEVMGLTIPGAVPPTWKGGSIQRVDLSTGSVTTLYTESSSGPLRAPNDLVFDGHGGFWFTDHGVRLDRTSDRTGIHYAKADGSSCEEVIFPLDAPNGIGLSPDGTRLYVAETHTGRVFAWDLAGPGEVASAGPVGHGGQLLAGLPGPPAARQPGGRRRGLGVRRHAGQRGHHRHQPRRRDRRAHPAARPPRHQHLLRRPDLRTAYATLSGTGALVAFDWPRPGLRLHHAR